MRTGEVAKGFTYLWLLWLLAITAAGWAALGTVWSTAVQRERERELLYRGERIAQALWSYHAAPSAGPARWPHRLEDLLEDRRNASASRPVRHLRSLYADPFTGQTDWVLERDEEGGVRALHSRSNQRAFVVPGSTAPAAASAPGAADAASARRGWQVSDHRFVATAPPGVASAASAAGGPGQAAAPGGVLQGPNAPQGLFDAPAPPPGR